MSAHRARPGSVALGALVPLLDTLFLLLFALIALSAARTAGDLREVHVRLPAVEPDPEPQGAALARVSLAIDEHSRVTLGGEPVPDLAALDRALARLLAEALPEEVPVELRADREARYGVAVVLLEHLRRLGFVDVRLVATGDGALDAALGGGR